MKSNIKTAAALVFACFATGLSAEGENASELQRLERLESELERMNDIPHFQSRQAGERAFAIYSITRPEEKWFYRRGTKFEEVHINTQSLRTFQYSPDDVITLYQQLNSAGGEESMRPVFQVRPPSDSRDGVAFLDVSRANGETPVTLPYVDLSPRALPIGGVRVVNLTALPLHVQIGNETRTITSFDGFGIVPPAGREFFPLRIGVRSEAQMRMIYRNNLQVERQSRVMLMVLPNTEENRNARPVRCVYYRDMGRVN